MKDEAKERFGQYLKLRREAAKLTQAEVATQIGYTSPQFISNWERGISHPPLNVYPVIAALYGIPPRQLARAVEEFHMVAARRAGRAVLHACQRRTKKTRHA